MTQFTSLTLVIYFLALPIRLVLGHGHMMSPRTRNYIAHIEGVWSMAENVPKSESCPHCLNSKQADGFCGIGNGGDYDDWYDSTGLNHMPWSAQYDLVVGEEFTVDVWLDTNHAGHMELYMCNLDSLIDEQNGDEVQACLDAFPLEFVRDNTHGIPQDTNYRMRAYFADVGRSAFEFVYKVPDREEYNNIAGGGRILMQWYYVTANSCFSPGYKGTAIGDYLNSKGWLRSGGNLSSCNLPFDKTGQSSPERFWNCAEVSLTHGGPAPPSTPYPTSSPASSPVGEPGDCGYCAWGTCDGIDPGDGWCHLTDANCVGPCNGQWCTNIPTCNSPSAPIAPAPTPVWAPTTLAPQPVAQPTDTPQPVSNPTPPTPTNGNLATTTRYWDCSGGACGCGYLAGGDTTRETHCHGNAMFEAPANNEYGAKFYGTAAVSPVLFNPSDQGVSWLGEGCGKCWKVTGTSNIQGYGYATTTLVLKGANVCPASNAAWCGNGAAHFDISAPGFDYLQASLSNTCQDREPDESDGFGACGNWMIDSSDPSQNCDCSKLNDPVLRAGCENFFSLKWNNVNVVYEEVTCPYELDRLPCWEDNNGWPAGMPEFCAANIEGAPNAPTATSQPTLRPTTYPTRQPVSQPVPTSTPPTTSQPTFQPTVAPTSQPTRQPTVTPTRQPVPQPVPTPTPPTPTGGEFCCTDDFLNCRSETDWCSQSASNCNNCNSNWIIPQGQCIKRWDGCGNDPSGCCSPGQCMQWYNGQHVQCLGNGDYCQCTKV